MDFFSNLSTKAVVICFQADPAALYNNPRVMTEKKSVMSKYVLRLCLAFDQFSEVREENGLWC